MISTLYLQAEIGAAIVAAFFVAIVISIIFYVIQRRSIKDQTIEKLTGKIFQSVPHREEITNLQESLAQFKEEMDEKMEKGEKQNVEIIEALKKQTESDIKSDVTEFAKQQITENTVGREEFDQLEQKINNYLGSEENVEKIKILEKIFDSDKLKTLNW
jgi:predicted PurR-regulated permease PerM